MRNTLTIYRKELHSYFSSPIAYGLMAFFALLSGYLFFAYVSNFVRESLQSQMFGRPQPMDVNEMVIRGLFFNMAVVGLFLIPMITMRLFAEEKRSGTFELLATSPVRDMEIIIGKWLAALSLYAAIIALSGLDMLILFMHGRPDWRPVLVGYLGLLLQGGCLLALGTFISNTTRNQIVAGTATFAVSLLLWLLSWWVEYDTSPKGVVIGYLSIVPHFENFSKGVIDSKDVVFYISMIIFGLFLTSRSMESLRWRA